MNPFDRYPDWTRPGRCTDTTARVCRYRYVSLIRAVRISGGTYRKAPVDGVFELFEPSRKNPIEVQPAGKRKVRVICASRGCKPNGGGRGVHVDVSNSASTIEVLEHYSGEVVDNIGHPADPPPLELDVPLQPAADLDAPPADRVMTEVSRIVRDTELSRWVKREHGYRCQICGETIRLADGSSYAEGHHLKPLGNPHNGPDVAENIVCLCPNHHAACDFGAIRLAVKQLQCSGDRKIGEEFIAYHNDVVFRG